MRRLIYYLFNPFKSKKISVIGLIRFTTELLSRFNHHNDEGQFDERIEATEDALALLVDAYTLDATKLGVRKARKSTKNQFRDALLPAVETIYGRLTGVYGARSDVLKEFFPFGRTIFSNCPDDMLSSHLTILVDQSIVHAAELEADLLTDISDLRDAWLDIYDASEDSTGDKASTEATRRNARTRMQDELYLCLLKIAEIHYKDDPDQIGLYMQQYLLGGPAATPVSGTNPTLPPPATGSGSTSVSTSGSSASTGSSGSGSGSSSMGSSGSVGSSSAGSSSMGSSNGGSSSSAGSSSAS